MSEPNRASHFGLHPWSGFASQRKQSVREYIGEQLVESLTDTEFKNYGIANWILYFVSRYGQIDGEHHKAWLLDQIARIAGGTPVIVKRATWSDGLSELRVTTGEPSDYYLGWRDGMELDGEFYDQGIAP